MRNFNKNTNIKNIEINIGYNYISIMRQKFELKNKIIFKNETPKKNKHIKE